MPSLSAEDYYATGMQTVLQASARCRLAAIRSSEPRRILILANEVHAVYATCKQMLRSRLPRFDISKVFIEVDIARRPDLANKTLQVRSGDHSKLLRLAS